jgi:hypothetical protein
LKGHPAGPKSGVPDDPDEPVMQNIFSILHISGNVVKTQQWAYRSYSSSGFFTGAECPYNCFIFFINLILNNEHVEKRLSVK